MVEEPSPSRSRDRDGGDNADIWWHVCTVCYRAFPEVEVSGGMRRLKDHKKTVHNSRDSRHDLILSQTAHLEPRVKIKRCSRLDNSNSRNATLLEDASVSSYLDCSKAIIGNSTMIKIKINTSTSAKENLKKTGGIGTDNTTVKNSHQHRRGRDRPPKTRRTHVHVDKKKRSTRSSSSTSFPIPSSQSDLDVNLKIMSVVSLKPEQVDLQAHNQVDELEARVSSPKPSGNSDFNKLHLELDLPFESDLNFADVSMSELMIKLEPSEEEARTTNNTEEARPGSRLHRRATPMKLNPGLHKRRVKNELRENSNVPDLLPTAFVKSEPNEESEYFGQVASTDSTKAQASFASSSPKSVQSQSAVKPKTRTSIFIKTVHLEEKPRFECTICGKKYTNKKTASLHVRSLHTQPVELKCPNCPKVFFIKAHFKAHVQLVHDESRNHLCPICGRSFKTSKILETHTRDIHGGDEVNSTPTHFCDHKGCGKAFQTRKSLQRHVVCHKETTVMCQECGRLFKTKERLKQHFKNVHQQDRLYKCDKCDETFRAPFQLKAHEASHVDGPVQHLFCSRCPKKTFKTKYQLKTHLKNHASKGKPITCRKCGTKCPDRAAYYAHQAQTHNYLRFACSYCDKRFSHLIRCQQHELGHKNERQFKCEFPGCGKGFNVINHLNLHKITHRAYEELPEVCDVNGCGKRFGLAAQLRYHKRKVHMKTETEMV